MSEGYVLECCVDSVESALRAEEGGADRLELCSNLVIGGTTPTPALFRRIRERSDIRIHALIRPRFGDFLYSEEEFAVILREVELLRAAGAEGVVIGCLNQQGDLDMEQMKRLMSAAGPLSVTLHRAFDMCRDPYKTLEQAVELGIDTILTSGQAPTCLEGVELINRLLDAAAGRITILAGAGINAQAVRLLLSQTKLTAYHMSGKKIRESAMLYRNPSVSMGLKGMSEYEIWETDSNEVAAVKKLLYFK